jgi:hypothetical protein
MKRLIAMLIAGTIMPLLSGAQCDADDTPKPSQLFGKIKIVEHHADVRVKLVNHHADLRARWVKHHADEPGQWQRVQHHPDYRPRGSS